MEVYNKNRDSNQSMRDEIREQNAKLKGAPLKEKFDYFKEYYLKMTVAAVIGIVFAACLLYTMVFSPSDTAFAAYFYNNTGDSSNTELIDGFVESMGINVKKQNAYIDTSIYFPINESSINYDAYMDLDRTMAVISSKELDIIVGETDIIDFFSGNGCFHDVTSILPEDLLEKFEDRLYYAKNGEDGELIPVGVYVTDSPKLNAYHYYVDKEPVLCFIVNSNNLDNAIAFLRYLYME